MSKLLTRDEFRESVFVRDNHSCVICGRSDLPIDAHHIIERRLWDNGGYFLNNGATLCDDGVNGCHYKAETTEITVEMIREACGITEKCIPEDMYHDTIYDKWGNAYLANGMRSIGPLFDDESVQKVLAGCLSQFTTYVKYPRTYHCPWSDGITDDDKVQKNMDNFVGKRVVVTEKMDGESTSIYSDYYHARSIDSRHHFSRDWAKSYAMSYISPNLPYRWRVCAENLYAVHSIAYENLSSYLLAFSIWNEKNICLSWDESVEYFKLLSMPTVRVLYDGVYDEAVIKGLHSKTLYDSMEGYVIRIADEFHFKDFNKCVAKFVRKNHVTSATHWMHKHGKQHDTNKLKDGIDMSTIIST